MEADSAAAGKKPRKLKYETKRPQLSVRLRADLHGRLRELAAESGFSISEEIERRLERSIDGEDELGGRHTAALARMVAANVTLAEQALGAPWTEQPHVRQAAAAAINRALEIYTGAPGGLFGLGDPQLEKLRLRRTYAELFGQSLAELVAAREPRSPRALMAEILASAAVNLPSPEEVIAELRAGLARLKQPAPPSMGQTNEGLPPAERGDLETMTRQAKGNLERLERERLAQGTPAPSKRDNAET